MASKMQMHNLFPTPVGCWVYGEDIQPFREITQTYEPMESGQGNRWADHDVLSYPAFEPLRKWIDAALQEYYQAFFQPVNHEGQEIFITESWVNFANSEESHQYHNHTNSIFSGVFYLEGNDAIEFMSPKPDMQVAPEIEHFNEWNASTWWLPAVAAHMYIWPSWLVHGVPTAPREEERISIAFNTFLKGTLSTKPSTQLTI